MTETRRFIPVRRVDRSAATPRSSPASARRWDFWWRAGGRSRLTASGLGRHDLDLVIRRERLVAFVEVKTRHSLRCGSAVESVSALKRRLIERVALSWRLRHGRPGDEYRFDLVGVRDLGRGRYEVEHVADAWRMSWSPC